MHSKREQKTKLLPYSFVTDLVFQQAQECDRYLVSSYSRVSLIHGDLEVSREIK